jgi:hypothetical protein
VGSIAVKNLENIVRTLVEASVDTGVATGGGTDYLDDTAKSWPDNAFANLIIEITGGTGAGQIRKIASNTATRITVTPDWTTVPDATSTYRIGIYGRTNVAQVGGQAVPTDDFGYIRLPVTAFKLEVYSATIATEQVRFVASGEEVAYGDLAVDGTCRVDGGLVTGSLVVNGKLVVNGAVEVTAW